MGFSCSVQIILLHLRLGSRFFSLEARDTGKGSMSDLRGGGSGFSVCKPWDRVVVKITPPPYTQALGKHSAAAGIGTETKMTFTSRSRCKHRELPIGQNQIKHDLCWTGALILSNNPALNIGNVIVYLWDMRAEGETKREAPGDVSLPPFLLLVTSQQTPARSLSWALGEPACFFSPRENTKPESWVLLEHLNLFNYRKYRMRQNRNILPWQEGPFSQVYFQSFNPPAPPWATTHPCSLAGPQKNPLSFLWSGADTPRKQTLS